MKRIITLIMIISACMATMAQDEMEFGTGLVIDNEAYERIPQKPTLLTRDFTGLPESYSLRQYCPKVGSQGSHGTCTAWSSTYAARTIAEAVKWGWTDQKVITEEAFAPLFIYAQIKNPTDSSCRLGTRMDLALNLLKTKGAPKFKNFGVKCAEYIPKWIADEAVEYPIDDYFTLFNHHCTSFDEKVSKIKKALSQDRPVLINMRFPSSFFRSGEVWEGNPDSKSALYHAMCVVAYDDHKEGGAFQIMNSWGETWGKDGYTWVKYADFVKCVDWAFEIYVKKARYPEVVVEEKAVEPVKPVNDVEIIQFVREDSIKTLSGRMYIQLSTGEQMAQRLTEGKWPVYRSKGKYMSGTRYRVYLSNDAPAYVYVIGSDLENNVSKVFPPAENISPALVYSSNNIALPNEEWYIEMDDTRGKDYLCVLYAEHDLPINEICDLIKQTPGTFEDKLTSALSGYGLVPINDVKYNNKDIAFKATTKGSVVPLVVEITHN